MHTGMPKNQNPAHERHEALAAIRSDRLIGTMTASLRAAIQPAAFRASAFFGKDIGENAGSQHALPFSAVWTVSTRRINECPAPPSRSTANPVVAHSHSTYVFIGKR